MVRKLVLSLILSFSAVCAFAASDDGKQVRGKVSSSSGSALPGVTVFIDGTATGTVTDGDGNYSIDVTPGSVLIFSSIGYETVKIQITSQSVVNVTLNEDVLFLDETIIVAYGTASRAAFTGSATQIAGDKIAEASRESIDKGMVGKIAGVRIGQDNGDPGSAGSIQIRGVGSISEGTSPLYVVDGVIMSNMDGDVYVGYKSSGVLSSLNPDDIESITVLKDAAAASLYGSRAANGVIVITTKRGSAGSTRVTYSGELSVSSMANSKAYEMMDGKTFIKYLKDAADNAYAIDPSLSYNFTGDDIASMVVDPTGETNTNWKNEIFRKALSHNHQLSLSAGTTNTQVYASLGYNNTQGIVIGSFFERFSGRLNVDHKVNNWLKLGFRQMISFSSNKGHSDQNNQEQGMGYATPIGLLGQSDPTAKPKNDDGSWNENVSWSGNTENPHLLFDSDREYNLFSSMRSLSNFDIDIRFNEKVTLKNTFGYDYLDNKQTLWWSPSSIDGSSLSGLSAKYIFQVSDMTNSTVLRYTDTYGDKHHLSAMAGFELSDHRAGYVYAAANNYPNDKLSALSVGQLYGVGGSDDRAFMMSVLANANYDYDDKYYVSGSFRRDGSSRLGPDNRWANFWSASGAWRLSEESWLEGNDLFNELKVKASYGTNGNLPGGYNSWMGLYSATAGYGSSSGIYWSNPVNRTLGWEKSDNFNVGFEWNLFGKVQLDVEYYNKYTSSLLFTKPASAVTGFDSYLSNVGNLANDGVELSVSTLNVSRENFTWNTDFNFTWQRSRVAALPDGEDIPYGDGNMYIHREGESMYSFYLPVWAGVNPDTGLGEFWIDPEDHSKGKSVFYSDANPTVVGKALPDFIGGMTNSFSFYGVDLSFLISYQFGGDLFDYPAYFYECDGFRAASMSGFASAADYWTPENRNAPNPKPIMNNPYRSDRWSSRHIKSTDNIRMREITLGYTVPVKNHIDNLRVYFKTTNPFMIWSATPDVDPDVTINGYRTVDVPVTKAFLFGLNFTF